MSAAISEPVWVALITSGSAFLLAVVGILGKLLQVALETRRHARSADHQVTNNHETNLREEGDVRHDEVKELMTRLSGEVSGLRRDIGRLWSADGRLDERLLHLEKTTPRKDLPNARSRERRSDGHNGS